MLYDASTKTVSPWLKRGQTWQGYTVMSFDAVAESLAIRREQSEFKLQLRTVETPIAAATPTGLPGLIKGTYTLLDGTILYSADAQLRLGDGFLISSPSGLMVSDDIQSVVGGDLKIETARGTLHAEDSLLEVKKGRIRMKGPVTFTANEANPVPITLDRATLSRHSGQVPAPALTSSVDPATTAPAEPASAASASSVPESAAATDATAGGPADAHGPR